MKNIRHHCIFALAALLFNGAALGAQAAPAKIAPKPYVLGADNFGKKIDLHDYAGKTVLISFYSAGCTVCARDLKLMREFYRDNNAKNFMLIGVNLNKDKADFELYTRLVAASTPKNQQFPLIWQGNAEVIEGFGKLVSDPTHFLINPQGQVSLRRESTFKPEDWDSLWEALNN